jgi:hypothetical protein
MEKIPRASYIPVTQAARAAAPRTAECLARPRPNEPEE